MLQDYIIPNNRHATLFYHDHSVGITSENVYAGECFVTQLSVLCCVNARLSLGPAARCMWLRQPATAQMSVPDTVVSHLQAWLVCASYGPAQATTRELSMLLSCAL